MKRRPLRCVNIECRDGLIPAGYMTCPSCCQEEVEAQVKERNEKRESDSLSREVGNWHTRALATVAAYQHYGLPIAKLNYQQLIFGNLSGDYKSMITYLKRYVTKGQKTLAKAEAKRGKK